MSSPSPRILLNDDGPPGPQSPYVYGLYRYITTILRWDVKVVVPSSQKSWIGKAFHITEITKGRYYYPKEPDGMGEVSSASRPLNEGEVAEWVLLDGTPATCTNIALHNLYPGTIDLVISGPNLGRNSSAAFAMSSGTIGAAMSSALSQVRSVAISYGTVLHPTPNELFEPAHILSARIIQYLWNNWGRDVGGMRNGEIDMYNVNVPMIMELLNPEGIDVHWTHMWRNSYGQLFKAISASDATSTKREIPSESPDVAGQHTAQQSGSGSDVPKEEPAALVFKFSPDVQPLITPSLASLPVGSDGWAIAKGHASITPLRACFAHVDHDNAATGTESMRILKF
ncbi:sure-like protein [Suillus clintonianus]|uniref:sure-like protein n=1 Tax=Suillus clintonianus TaxID=1904413 RepID=UPI001B86C210|nr:sure-like protein [Suillus clintonianus]KAG2154870.1 sure-like protein [Suillus clintonianus]